VQPKQAVAKKPKNEENNNTITTPKRGLQPQIFLKLTKTKKYTIPKKHKRCIFPKYKITTIKQTEKSKIINIVYKSIKTNKHKTNIKFMAFFGPGWTTRLHLGVNLTRKSSLYDVTASRTV
jgi:hypothetical protein